MLIKFSYDIKDNLHEICFMLSLPKVTAPQCISITGSLLKAELTAKYRHLHKAELNPLYTKHSVTEISCKLLAYIQKVFQVKSLTEKDKEPKFRLVDKLMEQREKIFLIANHYVSVLLLLKFLVLIHQTKKHEHPLHS